MSTATCEYGESCPYLHAYLCHSNGDTCGDEYCEAEDYATIDVARHIFGYHRDAIRGNVVVPNETTTVTKRVILEETCTTTRPHNGYDSPTNVKPSRKGNEQAHLSSEVDEAEDVEQETYHAPPSRRTDLAPVRIPVSNGGPRIVPPINANRFEEAPTPIPVPRPNPYSMESKLYNHYTELEREKKAERNRNNKMGVLCLGAPPPRAAMPPTVVPPVIKPTRVSVTDSPATREREPELPKKKNMQRKFNSKIYRDLPQDFIDYIMGLHVKNFDVRDLPDSSHAFAAKLTELLGDKHKHLAPTIITKELNKIVTHRGCSYVHKIGLGDLTGQSQEYHYGYFMCGWPKLKGRRYCAHHCDVFAEKKNHH